MPIFEYSALDRSGKKLKGTIDADSLRQARSKLRNQNIFPTDLTESGRSVAFNPSDVTKYFQRNSISQKELAITTRQLATLVNAGLPLVMALSSTAEQIESESIRRIMVTVREEVERGNSLSNAMENFPKAFPRLYVSMIASGEASGTLDTVLLNLADHLESQVELMGRVKAALMYPLAMLVICFLVIMGLFVFLVPKITDIFIKQGARLPLTTQITLFISNFLVAYWWLVIIAMIGVFILIGGTCFF
jgi:general secretion pathway protein F